MAPRLLILGWDSATFDLIDSLIAEGRLPALAALIDRGGRASLRSTWPPMTDCAWTSAFTGRNPAGHGIFGSWYRAPGEYACRYFCSRDRIAPALWELTEDVRHLVWNVPMTYPPEPVMGVMVAGYGAPPGAKFCEPLAYQERLAERGPIRDLLDHAPHSSLDQFLKDLVRGLSAQSEVLPWAIEQSGADVVTAIWPHVDRAQHFFWAFRETSHPLSDAVGRVYEEMDRATDALVHAFPDADVLVISDHGAGALLGDVNVGAWLAGGGYAHHGEKRATGSAWSRAAWALPPAVRRRARQFAPVLARRAMASKLKGQLGSFDWGQTQAFFGFHSDLWLNLSGREPSGCVADADAPDLLDEVIDGLMTITDPATGQPVFAGVHRRDEIYSGPAIGRAPDAIFDPWSAGYRIAPGREEGPNTVIAPAPLAGVETAWSSDHRPVGIFVAAGPHIEKADTSPDELSIYDVCPTALALLEQPIPAGLDGRVATEFLDPGFLNRSPLRRADTPAVRDAGGNYSEEEATAVAQHLRDLGYIE
jgi:predicted AlkP superfamily phosphohydrolase/phosphomutase